MNRVIHLLKKDMRYLRLLLVLWFVLLLVNSLLMRCGVDGLIASDEGIQVLATAYALLYVLQQILLIVIVCQLVQADALAGTTAFWLTRPISRKELLLSKSLFVLLILVLPSVLAEVTVLWVNGIPVSHMLSAVPEEVILQIAVFLIPATTVAALTPNLVRMTVAGVVSLTAFFLIHYTVLASIMSFGAGSRNRSVVISPDQWPGIFRANASGMLISAILMIGLGVMVIVYQYLKRRTVNSATGATLGMFLVIATLNFWPWDLPTPRQGLPARSVLNPDNVKLVVHRKTGGLRDAGMQSIMGWFECPGLPPGLLLEVTGVQATLRFPDGKLVPSSVDNPFVGMSFFAFLRAPSDFLQALEQVTVLNNEPGQPGQVEVGAWCELLSVDAETFQNYRDTPGTYSAEATLTAYQYQVVATLPLKPGSRYEGDSGEVTLLSIVPHDFRLLGMLPDPKRDGYVLTFRESSVRQWVRRTQPTGGFYVLRNRTRKEALLGRDYDADIFGKFPALHRLAVNRGLVYFTTTGIPDYRGPVLNEEWLRQAELLRIEIRSMGEFSKSVRVDNFVMSSE